MRSSTKGKTDCLSQFTLKVTFLGEVETAIKSSFSVVGAGDYFGTVVYFFNPFKVYFYAFYVFDAFGNLF